MYRDGLCRVFDAARDAEPAAGSKRIIGGAVAAAGARDPFGIPADDLVEQAHGSVVRDATLDPRAVQELS